jgi:hypothetical protein
MKDLPGTGARGGGMDRRSKANAGRNRQCPFNAGRGNNAFILSAIWPIPRIQDGRSSFRVAISRSAKRTEPTDPCDPSYQAGCSLLRTCLLPHHHAVRCQPAVPGLCQIARNLPAFSRVEMGDLRSLRLAEVSSRCSAARESLPIRTSIDRGR